MRTPEPRGRGGGQPADACPTPRPRRRFRLLDAPPAVVSDRCLALILLVMAGLVLARFDVSSADGREQRVGARWSLTTTARRRWRALSYVALLSAFLAATFSPRYRGRTRDAAAFAVRALFALSLQASFSFSQLRLADLPPPTSRAGWLLFARSRLVMPAIIAVSNTPGAIVTTRTPYRANSRAIGRVMETTPPFEAE